MARTAKTNFMGAELPPFMDFSKIAGEFKMPQFDTAALIEYQRRNLEAFTAANQLAFEGAKAITERQVELARQVWEESAEAARTLGTVGKPEDQLAQQTSLVKRGFERSVANLREIASWPNFDRERAARLLNALYLQPALIISRTHPAASQDRWRSPR